MNNTDLLHFTVVSGFLTPEEVEAVNAASAPYFDVTRSTEVKNQDLVEMGVDFHASYACSLSLSPASLASA